MSKTKITRYFVDFKEAMTPVFKSDLNGKRGIISHNADRVVGIVGYEGSGKSTLGLDFFELWSEINGRTVVVDDIKNICSNQIMLGDCAVASKKTDMIVIDEGALMSYSRQGMSQSNTTVNKFLMTCREEGFYILIMIPNILDLDSYIRKNRLSALIVILPNYKFAYFSRKRCRQLMPKISFSSRNNEHPDPMKMGVLPNFVSRFPKYEGVLLEPYKANKKATMLKIREEMRDLFNGQLGKKEAQELTVQQKKFLWLHRQGFSNKGIAKILDCSQSNVSSFAKSVKKTGVILDYQDKREASDFEIADARKQIRDEVYNNI